MHDRHVMIDLETLSTENDAAIIAIGAVEFDLDNIIQKKLWLIDPRFASGRRDNSTLNWWEEQDPVTAQEMWSGTMRQSDVAAELYNWAVPFREKKHWIWGDPSTFDLAIVKTWCQSAGQIFPFDWRAIRDANTLERVCDELGIDYRMDMEMYRAHNALDDCIQQARRVQSMLRALARQFDTREEIPTPPRHDMGS